MKERRNVKLISFGRTTTISIDEESRLVNLLLAIEKYGLDYQDKRSSSLLETAHLVKINLIRFDALWICNVPPGTKMASASGKENTSVNDRFSYREQSTLANNFLRKNCF